jgi:hypothetical protein
VRVNVFTTVQDLAGNAANALTFTFNTAPAADATRPTVVLVTPGDGATNVTRTIPVVLVLSEPINSGTVNGNTVTLYANGGPLSESIQVGADNTTITLQTTLPAATEISVVATDGIQDLAGNPLVDFASTFTTAADEDRTAPTIVTMRPASGSTRVSPATSVVLYASELLDPTTVGPGLFVSEEGVLVAGGVDTIDSTIEFTPATPFTLGAQVQVLASPAIRDLAGNPLTNFPASFRIVPDPTAENAFVEALSPRNGATGVPTNVILEARYSEPLDPTTVNIGTVRLFPSGAPEQPGTVSLVGGARVIRFVPTTPLGTMRSHSFQITNVRGADGGTANNSFTSFTTGTTSDMTAPGVAAISPPDGAIAVGVNAGVTVRFDEAINPVSVDGTTVALEGPAGTLVPCTISFADNNATVDVTPHTPLLANTEYTVTVDGVEDVAGNPVSATTSEFTTGAVPDTRRPELARTAPLNGAQGVPTNVVISVEFDEPIDPGTVSSGSIRVFPSGQAELTGTVDAAPDGRTVTFVPSAPLAAGLSHAVQISGIADVSGNVMSFRSLSFTSGTAADATGPQVNGVSPADGLTDVPTNAEVVVAFNEPISAVGLDVAAVLTAGEPVAVAQSLSDASRRLTLRPLLPLAPLTAHTLTLTGIRDLAGNAMAAPVSVTFTTETGADLLRPSVSMFVPASGSTGVPRDTAVTVTFNERVNPLTVTTGTFTLRDNPLGQFPPGTIAVSPDGLTATFTPDAELRATVQHTSSATTSITDLAGNALIGTSTTFTTGP